jgi:acyl-ACP thioesterase
MHDQKPMQNTVNNYLESTLSERFCWERYTGILVNGAMINAKYIHFIADRLKTFSS